jgi:hypothetical protein
MHTSLRACLLNKRGSSTEDDITQIIVYAIRFKVLCIRDYLRMAVRILGFLSLAVRILGFLSLAV